MYVFVIQVNVIKVKVNRIISWMLKKHLILLSCQRKGKWLSRRINKKIMSEFFTLFIVLKKMWFLTSLYKWWLWCKWFEILIKEKKQSNRLP